MLIYLKEIERQKNLANFKTNKSNCPKRRCLQYLPVDTAL